MHGLVVRPVRGLLDDLDGREQAGVVALVRDQAQHVAGQEPLHKVGCPP